MTTDADSKAAVDVAWWVEMSWGSGPTVVRYTGWDAALTVCGEVFSPVALAVAPGAVGGGARGESWWVHLPAGVEPAAGLVSGEPHARVTVTIGEVAIDSAGAAVEATRYVWWHGSIAPNGRRVLAPGHAVAELEVEGLKVDFEGVELGLIADAYDNVPLGHPANGLDVDALSIQVTVDALDVNNNKNRVDVTEVTTTPGWADHRWAGGALAVDGLAIGVQASKGGGTLDLNARPPSSWVGQTAVLYAGYPGTLQGAKDRGIEEWWMGIGYAMRDTNALTEV